MAVLPVYATAGKSSKRGGLRACGCEKGTTATRGSKGTLQPGRPMRAGPEANASALMQFVAGPFRRAACAYVRRLPNSFKKALFRFLCFQALRPDLPTYLHVTHRPTR